MLIFDSCLLEIANIWFVFGCRWPYSYLYSRIFICLQLSACGIRIRIWFVVFGLCGNELELCTKQNQNCELNFKLFACNEMFCSLACDFLLLVHINKYYSFTCCVFDLDYLYSFLGRRVFDLIWFVCILLVFDLIWFVFVHFICTNLVFVCFTGGCFAATELRAELVKRGGLVRRQVLDRAERYDSQHLSDNLFE